MSKKYDARLKKYLKVRQPYLEAHPNCEIRTKYCTGRSQEIHHSKGRIGDLLFNEEYFVATCRPCHDHIEFNGEGVKWAKEKGFVKTRI